MQNRSYEQWVGSFYRKSIPLCRVHHMQLHAGNLSKEDVKKLAIYRGKDNLTKKKKNN